MRENEELNELFEVLKDAPTEMNLEQVDKMVSQFPLMPAPFDWSTIINLNTILMTTIGTIFIAGTLTFFTGTAESSSLEVKQYQLETTTTEEVTDDATNAPENNALGFVGSTDSSSSMDSEDCTPLTLPTIENEVAQVNSEEEAEPLAQAQPTPDTEAEPDEVPDPNLNEEPLEEVEVEFAEEREEQHEEVEPAPEMNRVVIGKRTFDLRDFTAVSLVGAFDVYVSQGNFDIQAEGADDKLEELDLEVVKGVLKVKTKNEKNNWYGNKKSCNSKCTDNLKVHVRMPNLDGLYLSGSGDLIVREFDGVQDLDIHLSGSGDIQAVDGLNVNGNTEVQIAGSGDIELEGQAKMIDISIAGSGDVEALGFRAENVEVNIAGSGDVSVHSTRSLDASIMGSGTVIYQGDPNVSKSIMGSGDVRRH